MQLKYCGKNRGRISGTRNSGAPQFRRDSILLSLVVVDASISLSLSKTPMARSCVSLAQNPSNSAHAEQVQNGLFPKEETTEELTEGKATRILL
jgi:hypothetical protein